MSRTTDRLVVKLKASSGSVMRGLVLLVCYISVVCAHQIYQDMIPNGHRVPDPCNSGGVWAPVGHYDAVKHTSAKNPFGLAFSSMGHVWNRALCMADSDGDGATNGEELGDPNCVWVYGGAPESTPTGHPGICEPLGSTRCRNEVYTCGCHGQQCSGK